MFHGHLFFALKQQPDLQALCLITARINPSRLQDQIKHLECAVKLKTSLISLHLSVVPKCFKCATIITVPKKSSEASSHQQQNHSYIHTGPQMMSTALHLILTHPENKDSHVRLLCIDFSFALNTVIPQLLMRKLSTLVFNTPLCCSVHPPLTINGNAVQKVNSTKFLNRSTKTTALIKKTQQCLHLET